MLTPAGQRAENKDRTQPHISSLELFTQKDGLSSAEMTLQRTSGFQSRVAQGRACRLQRCTYITEGRAQPPDKNITQWKPLRVRSQRELPGKWSNLWRVANQQGPEALWRDVSPHISTFHLAKESLLCWESYLESSVDERIGPWHCGSACRWPQCCVVSADTQPLSCPTAPLVSVSTQLPAAASGSSKPWHLTVFLSFTCMTLTKVGEYLLKTAQKIFGRPSD